MAEQNEIKKKPPLIPPNFVTLAHLKERYFKEQEQEQKQREKEEQEKREREERDKLQRQKEEEEKEKEKEKQAVSKRGEREPVNRGNFRSRRPNDRRYRRRDIEESEVAMVCVVTASENAVEEAGSEGLRRKKRGSRIWKMEEWKIDEARAKDEVIEGEVQATQGRRKPDEKRGSSSWKQKGKRKDKARAEDEEVIGGEEQASLSRGVDKKSNPARRKLLLRGTPRHSRSMIKDESEGQPVEISKRFEVQEVIGGEEQALLSRVVDKESNPARRKRLRRGTPRHSRPRIKDESEGQPVGVSEKLGGEEVIGSQEQALPSQGVDKESNPVRRKPLLRGTPRHSRSRIKDESEGQSVGISEKLGGEEVIGSQEQALPPQGVDKEYNPVKRKLLPRGNPRHSRSRIEDELECQSVEISEKFEGLSMNGGNRREHRFSRGYPNRSNSAYGKGYGRSRGSYRREIRDPSMMWVKKGEVGYGNAGEVQ